MMSSQSCMVPNWNLRNQKQIPQQYEKAVEEEHQVVNTVITSQVNPQHHHQRNPSPTLVPKPNYEVAELTWENGQLAMHGLGGILPPTVTAQTLKPTWGRIGDTLESFVLQATCHNQLAPKQNDNLSAGNVSSMVSSSSGKLGDSSGHVQVNPSFLKKRVHSSAISQESGRNINCSIQEEQNLPDKSVCASVSATMSKDNDTTMMTWPSFDSPNWSFKSKATDDDDDDVSENLEEEECKNKGEKTRSHSARPSRAAAVHNQSERRRRDRINQKMKALQKLVPNASKTDKASMLDEVIEYLKNLQAQLQMMHSLRNMPTTQMMMPGALQQMQQQQLQMSVLAARMGMGMGMGMGSVGGLGMGMMPQSLSPAFLPQNHVPSTSHTFVPPQFVMPQMIQSHAASQLRNGAQTSNASVPFADPYSTFLAQSMNMDMYNKMATLYRQQVSQAGQAMASPSGSKGES